MDHLNRLDDKFIFFGGVVWGNQHKVWSSVRDLVIRLYLQFPDNFFVFHSQTGQFSKVICHSLEIYLNEAEMAPEKRMNCYSLIESWKEIKLEGKTDIDRPQKFHNTLKNPLLIRNVEI